jgi:hypothetical protein
MGSPWSLRRELLLSVAIPVLRGEVIRPQAGRRRWVKVFSPA